MSEEKTIIVKSNFWRGCIMFLLVFVVLCLVVNVAGIVLGFGIIDTLIRSIPTATPIP